MGIFRITPKDRTRVIIGTGKKGRSRPGIKVKKWESFDAMVLGLGNINSRPNRIKAICAVFDLQGFTKLCRQVDPELEVHPFLATFLDWFYTKIRCQFQVAKTEEAYEVYSDPPFFSKFMGDGIMLLWDTEKMSVDVTTKTVITCYNMCQLYKADFYSEKSQEVVYCPPKLRCGIAMGNVYSVGNGKRKDFFGACMNIAARLQKLGALSFCVNKRGFRLPQSMPVEGPDMLTTKEACIRGIGDKELVYVLKKEYETLKKRDKEIIRDVPKRSKQIGVCKA